VFVHDRPDARTALAPLAQWFTDYNKNKPHKGTADETIKTIHPQPIGNRILSGLVEATPLPWCNLLARLLQLVPSTVGVKTNAMH